MEVPKRHADRATDEESGLGIPKKCRIDADPTRDKERKWFREEGPVRRNFSRLMAMDAYSRHKEMINLYHLTHVGATTSFKRDTSNDRTHYDALKDNHKFLWTEADESRAASDYEVRLAKKYYDKLFKEYCIVDLTYYKQNKVAMRWRVEKEVKSGKGQFICGNKRCEEMAQLTSWEVNFSYKEQGERKNALVKVRLCPDCSEKLNYGSQKKRAVKKPRKRHDKKFDEARETKEGDGDKKTIKKEVTESSTDPSTSSKDVWAQPAEVEHERTVDEDIDDFLDQLFD